RERPTAAAAAGIEALGAYGKVLPREDPEILAEQALPLSCTEIVRALREGRPFPAKSGGDGRVGIFHRLLAQALEGATSSTFAQATSSRAFVRGPRRGNVAIRQHCDMNAS